MNEPIKGRQVYLTFLVNGVFHRTHSSIKDRATLPYKIPWFRKVYGKPYIHRTCLRGLEDVLDNPKDYSIIQTDRGPVFWFQIDKSSLKIVEESCDIIPTEFYEPENV